MVAAAVAAQLWKAMAGDRVGRARAGTAAATVVARAAVTVAVAGAVVTVSAAAGAALPPEVARWISHLGASSSICGGQPKQTAAQPRPCALLLCYGRVLGVACVPPFGRFLSSI